jgi:hypothetical protein
LSPLGNDVVDLEASENRGKSGDRRFLDRVFSAREQRLIGTAELPDVLLWALWAAKEAAYKAVSRNDPTVCSIPRRYPVLLDREKVRAVQCGAAGAVCPVAPGDSYSVGLGLMGAAGDACRLTGRVLTPGGGGLALRIAVTDGCVHALAAGASEAFDHIVERVDFCEEGGDTDDPSAFVRARLIREIAGRRHLPAEEIEIRKDPECPGAPRVFHRGLPLADEISLSHDGRFTAFAWHPGA